MKRLRDRLQRITDRLAGRREPHRLGWDAPDPDDPTLW